MESSRRQVVIWVNPKAGSGAARSTIESLESRLRRSGFDVEMSDDPSTCHAAIRRHHASGTLRVVVAAGGDGTLKQIVSEAPHGVPLIPLPLGTENLVARHLQITADPVLLEQAIAGGRTVWLDAGKADDELFLVMASSGFDAEVVRRMHTSRSGHIRRWSYAPHIMRAAWGFRYPALSVAVSGCRSPSSDAVVRWTARWVFVFNLPRYAMGLQLGAVADGTDGWLDVCTFRRGGLARGLYYLGQVLAGQHASSPDFTWARGRRIEITIDRESADATRGSRASEVPFQLDGDPGGLLPVRIDVVPKRVLMVVPSQWRRRSCDDRTTKEGV